MQATHPLATRAARRRFNQALRAKGVPAKVCGRCLAVKALTAFQTDRSKPDGRQPYCTACNRAAIAEYRAANRSRPLDIGDGHLEKHCAPVTSGGCGRRLIRGDFPRNRRNADQRDQWCRDCMARRNANRRLIKRLRLLEYWDEIGAYNCYLCQREFAADDVIHVEHVMPRGCPVTAGQR